MYIEDRPLVKPFVSFCNSIFINILTFLTIGHTIFPQNHETLRQFGVADFGLRPTDTTKMCTVIHYLPLFQLNGT